MPFKSLDGMKAQDAVPVLEAAISRMKEDPDKYKAMNNPNGWGKYEGVLEILGNILAKNKSFPGTVIQIT